MKTVTSISGGQTSGYLAANYHSDYLVFSLVRTSDKRVKFKDRTIAKVVEDRIQNDFIGTLEDDTIIYTILDLEQYLGKKIDWVTGVTFDELIKNKSNYLPNRSQRFCTTELKMRPIFHWWKNIFDGEIIKMYIGYRANEVQRAKKEMKKLNKKGLSVFKSSFEKSSNGRNKWIELAWRVPEFPLIKDQIYKEDIQKYWVDKPVRFAKYNNCIGCFNRSAAFLNEISKLDKNTFDWFIRAEKNNKGFFKKDISYKKINKLNFTQKLDFDSEGCASGFCGF